jgi:hypothetical protein
VWESLSMLRTLHLSTVENRLYSTVFPLSSSTLCRSVAPLGGTYCVVWSGDKDVFIAYAHDNDEEYGAEGQSSEAQDPSLSSGYSTTMGTRSTYLIDP